MNFTTTTEIVEASKNVNYRAKNVKTLLDYNMIASDIDIIINTINSTLETGFYRGIARDELLQARTILFKSQAISMERVKEL